MFQENIGEIISKRSQTEQELRPVSTAFQDLIFRVSHLLMYRPLINKPPLLNRDYNRDANIRALKMRGFVNRGSTVGKNPACHSVLRSNYSWQAGAIYVASGLGLGVYSSSM